MGMQCFVAGKCGIGAPMKGNRAQYCANVAMKINVRSSSSNSLGLICKCCNLSNPLCFAILKGQAGVAPCITAPTCTPDLTAHALAAGPESNAEWLSLDHERNRDFMRD